MRKYLAQINIGYLKAPIDHPSIADFADNLNMINAIAENSKGFIWRLKDEDNNATSFNPYNNDRIIINMSVWKDLDHLRQFVYRSEHMQFFKRRKEWFEPMTTPHMALWLVDQGNFPDANEGKRRLDLLTANGPSSEAFDYKTIHQFTV